MRSYLAFDGSVVSSTCAVQFIILLFENSISLNEISAFRLVWKLPPIVCHFVRSCLYLDILFTNGFSIIVAVVPLSSSTRIGCGWLSLFKTSPTSSLSLVIFFDVSSYSDSLCVDCSNLQHQNYRLSYFPLLRWEGQSRLNFRDWTSHYRTVLCTWLSFFGPFYFCSSHVLLSGHFVSKNWLVRLWTMGFSDP